MSDEDLRIWAIDTAVRCGVNMTLDDMMKIAERFYQFVKAARVEPNKADVFPKSAMR